MIKENTVHINNDDFSENKERINKNKVAAMIVNIDEIGIDVSEFEGGLKPVEAILSVSDISDYEEGKTITEINVSNMVLLMDDGSFRIGNK